MAGSFNLFRRYQKLALAALAIMAMLAFFVLPPVLQMGSGGATAADRQVVTWQGGGLTESGIQRELIQRRALNQFLMALRAAATGDERVQQPLPDNEAAVVETLVLAREAEANGIVVSDEVVNNFLSSWTGDAVPLDQIAGLIGELRNRVGITESDIFKGLRSLLLSRYMQEFALRGVDFAGAPAGWQWDDFCRLEQGATVEVVPVVAELLAAEVAEPSRAALESLYEQHKNDLPRARSSTPGFREPARVRYDMLVASTDMLVAESAEAVTDEEIAKFYEENKEAMFSRPAEEAAGESSGEESAAELSPSEGPKGAAVEEPKSDSAAESEQPVDQAEPAEEPAKPADDASEAAPEEGASRDRSVFRQASFLQADEAKEEADSAETASAAADDQPATEAADPEPQAVERDSAAGDFKPLDEVKEEIRSQLARQAADRKLGEIFDAIAGRIATYADDLDLAVALGNQPPAAPDLDGMAREYGLDGLRSELVTAAEVIAGGGIGSSFQLMFSEQFGVRQQRWVDMMFAADAPLWRPFVTRDVAGNRYLSWKAEERPSFVPPFDEVRAEVERVGRLIEARQLARKRAEQILADAAGKPLSEAAPGLQGLEVSTTGPFTWLTRGTAPFGSAPMLSDPDGVQMAGDSFMKAVFALEPGGTAVAFNEPQTVCYAIRLTSLEPTEEILRARFVDAAADPRRIETVAEEDIREVYRSWLGDVTRRQGIEWQRPPR